ncbi:MAG: efflux RND transporter periplasmic adaptor subunit [Holophagales bacterium]|nr:efflux RND transporter periplasmic adaptor subunit [Holophagales bacterium]MYH25349.1 efflux RND transporter periplasmic adaptor subunit [Holophagales bacterium]
MAASLDELKIDRSRGGRSGIVRIVWLTLVLAALGGGGLAGWLWWEGARIPAVRTAMVRQTLPADGQPTVLNASGYVRARLQSTVSSKITGRIAEVLVEEGMAVSEGQVLARLDDTTERSHLALAEAQLRAVRSALVELEVRHEEARLDLRRQRQLLDHRLIGQADFDATQADADSLQARIANQREQEVVAEREIDVRRTAREDTVIRAPFSGVAISRDAQPGEIISPMSAGGGFTRTGVCTIVDMSSLEIEVDVNESYIDRVSPGQRVVATLNAYPDWEIPARVITTIPAADRQRATVLVRIGFDEFGDPRILPDMGVNVAFLEGGPPEEEVPDAAPRLWIPSEALRSDGGRPVVFVVRGETVERRSVTTGLEDGGDVEVLAGVSAGERVVVEGPPVASGDRVVAD